MKIYAYKHNIWRKIERSKKERRHVGEREIREEDQRDVGEKEKKKKNQREDVWERKNSLFIYLFFQKG